MISRRDIRHLIDQVILELADWEFLRQEVGLLANHPESKFVIIGDHPKDKALSDMLDCPFIGVLTGHFSESQLYRYDNKKFVILNSVKDITTNVIKSLF